MFSRWCILRKWARVFARKIANIDKHKWRIIASGGSRILDSSVTYDVIEMNECFQDFMLSIKPPPPPFPGKFSYSVLQHWCKALQSHYSSTIRGLFGLFVYYSHYSLHYSSFINYRNMKHYNGWAIREQTIGKSTRYCSPIVVLYLTPGYEARVLVVIVTNIEIC
jgi:hypothetical protein